MTITKIYGGAGCGKTYYLIKEMINTIRDTPLHKIAMMTHTRNAREEFVQRAKDGIESHSNCTHDMPNNRVFQWFATMHATTWRLLGYTPEQMPSKKAMKAFYGSLYMSANINRHKKMIELDNIRRGCCMPATGKGFRESMKLTKANFGYRHATMGWVDYDITLDDCVGLAESYNTFLDTTGYTDYTRSLEDLVVGLKDCTVEVPFTKLFVDEFQDFTPLQHKVHIELSKICDDTWFCGDDLQTIYTYAGASPSFLLNDRCDVEIVLPKTYRYGVSILKNSEKYIRGLADKKDRDVDPANHDSYVKRISGDRWLDVVDPTTETIFLCRTSGQRNYIGNALAKYNIMYDYIGDGQTLAQRMSGVWNTMFDLKSGGVVSKYEILPLLAVLPAKAAKTQQHTLTNDLTIASPGEKKTAYLRRGIKTQIKKDDFLKNCMETYDITEFGEAFLHSGSFGTAYAMEIIPGMKDFIKTFRVDMDRRVPEIIHHIGTIHKFKGNESDNVFVFTQIPYPISAKVMESSGLDDERRVFYVAATRARKNLYEVGMVFKDYRGDMMKDICDVI